MFKWLKNLRITQRIVVAISSFALLGMVALFFVLPRLEHYFLIRAGQDQSATLRLAADSLRQTLERYALIPNLIAKRPEIEAFFDDPKNAILKTNARQLLAETAIALHASGVYLEDANGIPLIAVPALSEDNTTGDLASYRPYFNQAVAGGLGQYYALGTQSGERGFFYAAPVREQSRINGVVAIKFAVDRFEAAWQEGRAEIIVRDANDVIFMSSRSEWIFRAMVPLPEERLQVIAAAKQFPVDQLIVLDNESKKLTKQYSLITIQDEGETRDYVSSMSLIARAGWRVTILTPTDDAVALARIIAASFLLFILLASMFGLLLWQRRARQSERMIAHRIAQELLEGRVEERTVELNVANSRLRGEVEDRKLAEQKLRKMQKDLIQAGKLAALGQMSAAISHELNQPLTAVKAYAENASTYLNRGMHEKASSNMLQISSLADRMATIAKHLRNFARRPQDKTKAVSLIGIIDDAISIMTPRMSKIGAALNFKRPENSIHVIGGQVRLQQVLVNLISNSLDAMANSKQALIDIEIINIGAQTHILVRDYGDGLSDDAMKLLFDPFYTTKDPGKGLGLGLSISYNILRDFGGNLSAKNHEDVGAIFDVALLTTDSNTMNEAAE